MPWRTGETNCLRAVAVHIGLVRENELLARERLEAISAERNRLARELHDTVAQDLAAISLHLASARRDLYDAPADAEHHLQQAGKLARSSLAEARRSIDDLRASPRLTSDLVPQLRLVAEQLSSRANVEVEIETYGEAPLPENVSANLLRIAQESLNNALKHSGASRIAVRVEFEPTGVRLSVRDNGCGFDPAGPRTGGYGLIGIEERAAEINGKIEVNSRSGEGTEVLARANYA